ncbi:MAG TPA: efflux RND transporter periplasmic adaptor subunit [Gammaproteobacteria bacterium]|nr:efflux RND transporter periplasmic adaptor subunit [Gammaproteobacteria bacterium]
MEKKRKAYLAVLVLGIILAMLLLIRTKPVKQVQLTAMPPVHVTVVELRGQAIHPREKVTGRLQASRKATLHFELAGQLAERHAEPGQRVEAGQVLLRLAEGDYQDALQEAGTALQQEQATIARDRQLLTLATRQAELQRQAVARFEQLGRQSMASNAQRDEAQARLLQLQADEARLRYSVDTAAARVQQREAALSRAQRNLERTRLQAPFKGVVNEVFAQPGDYVAPNVPMLDILNVEQLDLYAEVPGGIAAALQLGQQVDVRIGGQHQQGEIVALQTDPNPATSSHALRIRLAGQVWLPGELAQAEFALKPLHDALVVPIAAILQEEGKAYVFVAAQGVLQRRAVMLGPRVQDRQVISGSVRAGENIVARDVAALAEGERVIIDKTDAITPIGTKEGV